MKFIKPEKIVSRVTRKWSGGRELLFSEKPLQGMGDGELSFVATLVGLEIEDQSDVIPATQKLIKFLAGQGRTFDVQVTSELLEQDFNDVPSENMGNFEVKKPSASEIRLSRDGCAIAVEGLRDIRTIAFQVGDAFEKLKESLELYLPTQHHEALAHFVKEEISMIDRGEITRGRIMGHIAKESRLKSGLLQCIETLKRFRDSKIGKREILTMRFPGDRAYATDIVRIARALPLMLTDREVPDALSAMECNALQIELLRALSHPIFDDPDEVLRCFDRIAPPEKCFEAIDYLAITSGSEFRVIARCDLPAELALSRVTQGGRPIFKTKFSVGEA